MGPLLIKKLLTLSRVPALFYFIFELGRTNTTPYGTKANAAGRSGRACACDTRAWSLNFFQTVHLPRIYTQLNSLYPPASTLCSLIMTSSIVASSLTEHDYPAAHCPMYSGGCILTDLTCSTALGPQPQACRPASAARRLRHARGRRLRSKLREQRPFPLPRSVPVHLTRRSRPVVAGQPGRRASITGVSFLGASLGAVLGRACGLCCYLDGPYGGAKKNAKAALAAVAAFVGRGG